MDVREPQLEPADPRLREGALRGPMRGKVAPQVASSFSTRAISSGVASETR